MDIIIIGGGIVGLCSALSLADAGFRPVVYEAVTELRPLGVGINVLPHAVRELTELGLLDLTRSVGHDIDRLDYHMQDGRKVWSEARGSSAGYDWPQVAVHRGAFHMALLGAVRQRLGADAVRTGHALRALDQHDDHVTAHFADRATGAALASVQADVLIGADGIHSAVRKHFYPQEGKPVWNGVSLFRSTTHIPAADAQRLTGRMLWAGHSDQKFIAYPIGRHADGGLLLNWVADLRTSEPGATPFEDWNRTADKAMLCERFASWCVDGIDISGIIAAAGDVFEFPMVDRDPLPRWSFDRVTLAGDAAHPMYPIGSNGATQGIIDSRALAYHLATAPDTITALSRYEDARREATTRIVLGNRAQGPDKVLELARQRAPLPSDNLDALLPISERQEISSSYKRLAGFDPALLNTRESWSVQPARSRQ